MTSQELKTKKAAALNGLLSPMSPGARGNLADLLECEITEAHQDMENASDNLSIWRAQGRAAGARQLLSLISKS